MRNAQAGYEPWERADRDGGEQRDENNRERVAKVLESDVCECEKGAGAMNIYRGNGLTVVTKTNREWVTAITTGEGLDLGIQMLP